MAINPYTGVQIDPTKQNVDGSAMSIQDQNKNLQLQLQQQQAQAAATAKAAADMAAQGKNPDGSPIRQAFDTIANPNGTLQQPYTMSLNGLDPSQWQGYQQYKTEALRTGPSAWATLQNQNQDLQSLQQKQAAAQQAQSSMNQGNQNLASHGGLSQGAAALAARSSARDMLAARQNVGLANQQNKLGIATTDEGNRVAQLGNLANTEQQIGTYNNTLQDKQAEFNINNMLAEQQGKRAYNDNTYNQQMQAWAAAKTADATAKAGGGGGGK
jgi:hypothetical protein